MRELVDYIRSKARLFGFARSRWLIALGLFIVAIPLAALLIEKVYEARDREDVEKNLTARLEDLRHNTHHYLERRVNQAVRLAHNTELLQATRELLAGGQEPADLAAAPAQGRLRSEFAATVAASGFEGYLVVSPERRNLASPRDENLGSTNLRIWDESIFRAFDAGGQATGLPVRSDVFFEATDHDASDPRPAMFVGAPIRGEDGRIIATLFLRIDVTDNFWNVFHAIRHGVTGESYAFDGFGRMISNPRHDGTLIRSLLPGGSLAAGDVLIPRDSGADLAAGEPPQIHHRDWPLTWLAQTALDRATVSPGEPAVVPEILATVRHSVVTAKASPTGVGSAMPGPGESSSPIIDVEGHLDFRGVSVVGAALWDAELGLGFATQIDTDEAFVSRHYMIVAIAALAEGSMLLFLFLVMFMIGAARRIAEGEMSLNAVMANTGDGFIVANRSGRIDMINETAAELFGYRASDLLGQNLSMLVPEGDRAACVRKLPGSTLEGPVELTRDRRLFGLHRAGRLIPIELAIAPFLLDGRQKFIATVRDNTYRQIMEEINRAALAKAKEASEMKSAFLARMSHELRTPLNAIKLYSEALRDDAEDLGQPEMVSDLEKILFASQHQLRLINDVLDLAKIESGSVEVEIEPFALKLLANEILSLAEPLAAKKGNRLIRDFPIEPGAMTSDRAKLRQIIVNLLSNAAKFTEKGEIRFVIESYHEGGVEWVRFAVEDTGIGMSAEDMESIFEPFKQAGDPATSVYGGTGLGLAITMQLSERLGGRVWVDSRPGEGSTFAVELPLRLRPEGDESDEKTEAKMPTADAA